MFSPKKGCELCLELEELLEKRCNMLTLSQRCADWFLLKMIITGTMAGKIISQVKNQKPPYSHEFIHTLFQQCLDSWFSRHKSSSAMKAGTLNEEPTIEKLCHERFIMRIFECGLIVDKANHCLGVSPDGIALLIDEDLEDDDAVSEIRSYLLACVEIKTRVSENTIDAAEAALSDHGRIVKCRYGDATFKECVPANNRGQVLHQATICHFLTGVFVTAKVEEEEGSIIQIVIIKFDNAHLEQHRETLLPWADTLIGWMYESHVRERGYLKEDDMPPYLSHNKKSVDIMKSRSRLLLAHLKIITKDGGIRGMLPVQLYKHHVQIKYNRGKAGLDKNTEVGWRVNHNTPLSFETKYVLSMVDRVLVNTWRAEMAVTLIKPWMVSLTQKRDHAHQLIKLGKRFLIIQPLRVMC